VLTIATVNVNGIRAAWRKGMPAWLAEREPDVVLLQEVRAPDEMLPDFFDPDTWDLAHQASELKGRAGVAIASRLGMQAVRIGLGEGATNTGRWVEADVALPDGELLTVASVYIHSGEVGTPKQDDKYAFLDLATQRLAELADGRRVVVGGDFNVAHREVDIKNWKGNLKSAGFLPEERAYLDRWFESGWTDLGRALGGDGPGPYTWWSNRGKAFDNDAGWRIDYQIATEPLASRAVAATVDRAPAWDQRWSDHAPLVVTYEL
jgi:exodeoxyribonuclease-3